MGYPYITNPLIGSAEVPEVFNASLKGFDCVTYVESVLALALSDGKAGYREVLKSLRYDGGDVNWRRRNHFMTQWLSNNVRNGLIRRLGKAAESNRKERVLSGIPGLPPKKKRFSCIPKRAVLSQRSSLQTGDLIFFASTRPHLDVFHCGFLICDGPTIRLRHAASAGEEWWSRTSKAFLRATACPA